mmetsp:Transcript_65677/g.182770  ORF Transcript_65677/g.182770 Transcript_65677/m.182770 type:complete len:272 (-) Transcript_65677:59-874(-)|eukprot:CAMPEP_0117557926 /NCGR_PEP_ID=MMETSP0784-20121206/52573_1 /TAXON_ID=39447 /ORGANISM="" /LENGTH=271 /DNA_ID=CAMNT_0005355241 /DNA_START=53 /DNA_END=868 /DNA_ORIENTATION=+
MATALAIGGGVIVFAFCGGKTCAKAFISKKLAKVVENVAPSLLGGTKVKLESLSFSVNCSVKVDLRNMTVYNPEGFASDHLVQIEQVKVKVNLCKLIFSGAKQVQITLIYVKGCQVIYEKTMWSSNLDTLLKNIDAAAEKDKEKKEKEKKELQLKTKIDLNDPKSLNDTLRKKEEKKKGAEVTLRTVEVTKVTAVMTTATQVNNNITPATVKVADIEFADFSKEFGKKGAGAIVRILVQSITKSVLANILTVGSKVSSTGASTLGCFGFSN